MRESIKQFVKIISETIPIPEPIYEFGSLQVAGQEGFADLRPFFKQKKYVGCDMRKGVGVDRVLDLHNIDVPLESVGTILVLDTLEHVEYIRKAMSEVKRILKPNGLIVISSVMNFPIHSHPEDYWRFTPEAFKSMLKPFGNVYVESAGEKLFPHTIIGIGSNNPVRKEMIKELDRKIDDWKKEWFYPVKGWRETLKRFTPPNLLELSRKIRGLK